MESNKAGFFRGSSDVVCIGGTDVFVYHQLQPPPKNQQNQAS